MDFEEVRKTASYNKKLQDSIKAAVMRHLRAAGRTLLSHEQVADAMRAANNRANQSFGESVKELNERFRRANAPIHYHNGFIQITSDDLIESKIEEPFWKVVSGTLWKNVGVDMKEALHRRDAGERDAAFYAARALESAIKIISDTKGWTHGGENGAHAYINNLISAKDGNFIADWEGSALKAFFTSVRNPLGHGPGGEPMPELTRSQTDWAIEACMSWVRSLVSRL